MLEAVLFDWGSTLMDFVWDDALVEEGHRAGLRAIGRDDPDELERLSAHFRERYLPLLHAPGTVEEVEYPGLVRELLAAFGIVVSDPELNHYLLAEHRAWDPTMQVGATSVALLESLRARGLKTGLVSNATDPGWLLRADLERQGLAPLLDTVVFSSELGKRKPHPAIYEAALSQLGVAPRRALFVGDRLVEDVQGPAELGMKTVQAVWFRADENPNGIEPDYQAFTQIDVLNVVERLSGRR
ncbi:MAG TPA: HAD family hydrolase [Gaiellaceae bacterium]|nr:HAD family hydrolase [Gaiellaceae bacterium]